MLRSLATRLCGRESRTSVPELDDVSPPYPARTAPNTRVKTPCCRDGGVHIGLQFKDVGAEGRVHRIDHELPAIRRLRNATARGRREVDKGIEKRLHAEIRQSGAKKDRRHVPILKLLFRERVPGNVQQFQVMLN